MAAQNRHLSGDIDAYSAPVKGATVVEAGDIMWLNSGITGAGGHLGNGLAADFYAYPASDLKPSTGDLISEGVLYNTFLGIAMESSPSGVTENITVATAGQFRFKLHSAFVTSDVTIGQRVSAVSEAAAASGISKDVVIMGTTNPGSTVYLGYCQKTESAVTFIDFEIRTIFGANGLAT